MKTTLNLLMISVLALFLMQCEVVSDDHLQSPNSPSPENVNPDFLLNNIQLGLAGKTGTDLSFFQNLSDKGAEVTRMTQMFGTTYENAYGPQLFDDEWELAYSDILIAINNLIPLARERELYTHVAIAQTIRAYTLIAIADFWGDAPYSEALDPSNFNPAADTDESLYQQAMTDLDSALVYLGRDELAPPSDDLYYDGDEDNWTALVNTLKLKVYVQQRRVTDFSSEINDLIANANLIDSDEEAFVFQHSSNPTNPDSRHPEFIDNYLGTTDANDYMNNYFMDLLLNDKSTPDPRIRYYLYRQQTTNTNDVNEKQCINEPVPSHFRSFDPWCELTDGYWGRDHGVALGIPPDDQKKTTFGVYPAGGAYDDDQEEVVDEDFGLQGAGIQPMWMPFYTDFLLAESALALGTSGDPAVLLQDGIEGSMNYVSEFGQPAADAVGAGGMTQGQIDNYVAEVLDRYNNQASGDPTAQMSVIAREFYLALFGNGVEAYNLVRRSMNNNLSYDPPNGEEWRHFPRTMQVHRQASPGLFYSSFTYPAAYVERNSNAQSKPNNHVQVFWDNSEPTLFDF